MEQKEHDAKLGSRPLPHSPAEQMEFVTTYPTHSTHPTHPTHPPTHTRTYSTHTTHEILALRSTPPLQVPTASPTPPRQFLAVPLNGQFGREHKPKREHTGEHEPKGEPREEQNDREEILKLWGLSDEAIMNVPSQIVTETAETKAKMETT